MSSAIKRLSTIIRPSSNSSPPSKDPPKDSIDAPAPAAPVIDTEIPSADAAAPTVTGNGTTTAPADSVKDTVTSAPPADGAAVPPEDTPSAEPTKDKDAAPAPADAKKDKDAKSPPSHRRDPRDIGRSTIRRFSTILRSQGKDANKDQTAPATDDAKPAEDTPQPEDAAKKDEDAPKDTSAPAEPAAADQPAKTSTPPSATKDTTGKDAAKVNKRPSSSFFTAAREGLQRTAKDVQTRARPSRPAKEKTVAKAEAVVVAKIVKKGAARGKRVVVVTGASKGVGLEFVKQFAAQPNTFVIALSRTADKSPALKPLVAASAKEGHNVRALKLDVTSTRSTNNVLKDIVDLTDGRIDLLINAAGSRGNPVLKVWDLKGNELEDELKNNLVGPIAFTNALLPYLKPMPPKEEKKEEKEEKPQDDKDAKGEAKEVKAEAKDEKADANADKPEVQAEKLDAKQPDAPHSTTKPAVEDSTTKAPEPGPLPGPEAKVEERVEPAPATTSVEPSPETGKPVEPTTASTEPPVAAEPEPALLPAQPFIVFLAPADPIQNVGGTVPTGSVFAPAPRTLFSLSRAALQVAIAKYAVGLGGRGVGVVGVERLGQHDPHAEVSDEQAAASVVRLLPALSVRDNGKLLRGAA